MPSNRMETPRLTQTMLRRLTIDSNSKPLTVQKFFSLLSKLCKSNATGLDKISAWLLREFADLVASSLYVIFNRSIVSGVFPTERKSTKVIPLFKQGERSDLNNYHPISIILLWLRSLRESYTINFTNIISQGFVPFTPLLPPYSKPQIIGLLISIKVMLMQWFFLIWRKLSALWITLYCYLN